MKHLVKLVLALLLTAALVVGCGDAPEPGDPCDGQGSTCNGETFLVCQGGKWVVDPLCFCRSNGSKVCA